ncbi:hypothetical protein [Bartonella tribocorum]|uniref:Uncharacterized protein n=1 Tax=Bartonella tribocorum TaxID=85701 RepID=A0A2M6UU48_9HYPH|nr:hypothetical protein [Bartonella tribocorum]PIT69730.1 hypothetical protein CEV08_05485 [Bartonella tribocorum]
MLISIKKDIKKLPKADFGIICALSPNQLGLWIMNEWCVKNKQAFINSDHVNGLTASEAFYRSQPNDCYGNNSTTSNFSQKMAISFMELMLRIIITLKLHYFLPLIRFEAPYRLRRLLNFSVVMKNSFPLIPRWGYETANFSQKKVLFSGNSYCTIDGTTQ